MSSFNCFIVKITSYCIWNWKYVCTSLLLKGQTAWIGTKFKVNLQHIVQSYFHQSNWSQDLSCYPNLYMFDLWPYNFRYTHHQISSFSHSQPIQVYKQHGLNGSYRENGNTQLARLKHCKTINRKLMRWGKSDWFKQ